MANTAFQDPTCCGKDEFHVSTRQKLNQISLSETRTYISNDFNRYTEKNNRYELNSKYSAAL